MSEPTFVQDHVAYDSPPGTTSVVPTRSPAEAEKAVAEILAGRGRADDLPVLVARLARSQQEALREKLGVIAQLVTGDATLDIGELIDAPFGGLVTAALAAKRRPPTADHLQRYVARGTAQQLSELEPTAVSTLKKLLGHPSLLTVMPRIAEQLYYFDTRLDLVHWLLERTAPAVIASLMGTGGSMQMGALLDANHLWEPWIQHVTVALPGYDFLASGAKDPKIIARLLAPFGSRAKDTAAGGRAVAEPTPDQVAAVDQAQVTGESDERLVAAINEAGAIRAEQYPAVIQALRRLRAPADRVLELSVLADAGGPAITPWLVLLLESPGVSADHVMALVGRSKLALATLTAPVVRQLRARGGRTLHLHQLFELTDHGAHGAVIDNEGLRQWFLDEATPAELFWLCTQDPAVVTKATRIVVARHPDWAWVRQLTGGEEVAKLRSLALACTDAGTARFIREELVHDTKGVVTFGGAETSAKAYGGELERLHYAIALGDAPLVMERLADLDAAELRTFGGTDTRVMELFTKVSFSPVEFARAAELLDLAFARCLAYCPTGATIISHLRTRSPAEEAAALADRTLLVRAAKYVTHDLLVVFPSLNTPAVLARALDATPDLMQLLLAGSNPLRVVDLISVEPAATHAIAALVDDRTVLRLLPARNHLSQAGRAFVESVARTPELSEETAATAARINDDRAQEDRLDNAYDEDEKRAVERASAIHRGTHAKDLDGALDEMSAGVLKRDSAALMAVLAEFRGQVPKFLSEPGQWPRVAQLAKQIDVEPAIACPFIAVAQLLAMPNALRWYFELEQPTVLLHLVERPGVGALLAQHLGANTAGARAWLRRLPRGAALTEHERQLLDVLERSSQTPDVIHDLFYVRFGVQPPPVESPGVDMGPVGLGYNAGDLDSLYRVASRLPASHLDQQRINRIAAAPIGSVPGANGLWNGSVVTIGPEEHEGNGGGDFHPDFEAGETPEQGWLSAAEVKRSFGYDDAAIAAHVKAHDLLVRNVGSEMLYKMKPVAIDSFTQVVLHEIGHSVDDMLGNQTAPVTQFAGWRQFNDNEFDAWAGEMGGWDTVSAADRPKIKQAWIDAARANVGVHQLVDAEHPALSSKYADVGIVKAGREQRTFSAWHRDIVNGRMFVAGSYPGQWYSLNAAVVPSAPSYYSLYAPAEYFAESYVEYYRGVDGSPGSASKKGGGLAAPVKQFFDQKVDALKYDPRRFDAKGDADAPSATPDAPSKQSKPTA